MERLRERWEDFTDEALETAAAVLAGPMRLDSSAKLVNIARDNPDGQIADRAVWFELGRISVYDDLRRAMNARRKG
ncbi:MAG: hypothetical protein D6692_05400 [Planctomycetota bacterium]|nr:MAG: hypothetical protein D6692_05400 [Planctomycetota bacterium]